MTSVAPDSGKQRQRTSRQAGKPTKLSSQEQEWLVYRDGFVSGSAADKIRAIREGARAEILIGAATRLNLAQDKFFAMVGMSLSTAKRKIIKRETLDPMVTERLTRIGAVEKLAEQVFGNLERANAWLRTENLGIGAAPLSLLDTAVGASEVMRELNAIAYGMAA